MQSDIFQILLLFFRFAKGICVSIVKALNTSEAHEVSLLFVLWYIHSGGNAQRMTTITNGAQVGTCILVYV